MTDSRRNRVILEAHGEVAIEGGLTLRAGKYPAIAISVPTLDRHRSWTPPEYVIELSNAQMLEMGGKAMRDGVVSAEIDVTKQVRDRKLNVI